MISMEKIEWEREPDKKALEQIGQLTDFFQIEAAFKKLIEQGSILSMNNLARWYELKPETHGGADLEQAEFWYQKAIDAGSAVVTLAAGNFYRRKKDYEKAHEIYAIGMDRGYTPATARFAELYIKGWGVERNLEYAKDILKIAADRGHLRAKFSLGKLMVYLAKKEDTWTICKGGAIGVAAAIQIRYQMWRNPRSERLKL